MRATGKGGAMVSRIVGWLLLFGFMSAAGYFGYHELKDRAFPQIIPARTATIARGDLVQQITLSGQVVPSRRTLVTPPYTGYVRKVYVKVGDKIGTGAPLVSVAPSLGTPDEEVFPIRAPYPGLVVQVLHAPGEYVVLAGPDSTLLRIDDRSRLLIDALVPELDLVKLKLGQEAVVKATAISDRSYRAIVREIALAARETQDGGRHGSGTNAEFAVKLEISDFDERLRSGMSVIMDVIAAKREGVLIVAHEFLDKTPEGTFVTMTSGARKAVTVGLVNEEQAEIAGGLKEGDVIKQREFAETAQEK